MNCDSTMWLCMLLKLCAYILFFALKFNFELWFLWSYSINHIRWIYIMTVKWLRLIHILILCSYVKVSFESWFECHTSCHYFDMILICSTFKYLPIDIIFINLILQYGNSNWVYIHNVLTQMSILDSPWQVVAILFQFYSDCVWRFDAIFVIGICFFWFVD